MAVPSTDFRISIPGNRTFVRAFFDRIAFNTATKPSVTQDLMFLVQQGHYDDALRIVQKEVIGLAKEKMEQWASLLDQAENVVSPDKQATSFLKSALYPQRLGIDQILPISGAIEHDPGVGLDEALGEQLVPLVSGVNTLQKSNVELIRQEQNIASIEINRAKGVYEAGSTTVKRTFYSLSFKGMTRNTMVAWFEAAREKVNTDDAALNGGIDLNAANMAMSETGDKAAMAFGPAMLAQFNQGHFTGITPVIINIVPILSLAPLMGLDTPRVLPPVRVNP